MRKDVIFKNVLRDVRKFFHSDFDKVTDYLKKRGSIDKTLFHRCLHRYAHDEVGEALLAKAGLTVDDFQFTLGSLLFPRRMQVGLSAEKNEDVWRIRNMLYEFRNVTLDAMLADRAILFLITYYLTKNKMGRIKLKRTLLRNKNAYMIAIAQIYEKSQVA